MNHDLSHHAASGRPLPWIKYNPAEWNGRCANLSNAELGVYYRVLALLWASPTLTLPLDVIRLKLRIKAGTVEDELLTGLVGLVLDTRDGQVCIDFLFAAFDEAVARSRKAEAGGRAKAAKRSAN